MTLVIVTLNISFYLFKGRYPVSVIEKNDSFEVAYVIFCHPHYAFSPMLSALFA
jgi:hypothetical protein